MRKTTTHDYKSSVLWRNLMCRQFTRCIYAIRSTRLGLRKVRNAMGLFQATYRLFRKYMFCLTCGKGPMEKIFGKVSLGTADRYGIQSLRNGHTAERFVAALEGAVRIKQER